MSSRKQSRILDLLQAVTDKRVLHVKAAAALLQVSEMTVRRDIAENPELFGFLGGHIVPAGEADGDAPYDLSHAADHHASAKRQACAQAVKFLRPDETIFIDCGTTLTHLVDLLPQDMPLTIVCYALNIAEKIAKKPHIHLILMGGIYHPASASFSGPAGLDVLEQTGINTAFLSAAGLDLQRGATCAHFHEAEIKRRVIARARQRVLVIDSSKIGRLKPAFFAELSAFDAIITENGLMDVPADGAGH